jgi:hypothetical protein
MRLLSVRTFVCLLAAGSAGTVAASEPSGTAIAVVQSTQALGQAGNRVLRTSGAVYSGDQIVTSARGQAQVIFKDNTKLVVGPNSRMQIDAFVFNGNSSAKVVSINAVRGAFRFITGSSAKSAYKITTPTATIGVRGTQFDFNVTSRRLDLAVFSGQTRVCDRGSGTCFVQNSGCSLSQSGSGRNPRVSKVPRAQLDQIFPYIRQQGNLRAAFRVNTSSCGVQRAALPGGQGGSSRLDYSSVGSVDPSGFGGGVATSGGAGFGGGGGTQVSSGGSRPSDGGTPSGGGGTPSGGGGQTGGGGGGNGCGNCGNGVGNGGGNGTGNEGRGNAGNGDGGTAGNSGNAPGHSGGSPGNSGSAPGRNK